MHRSAKILSPVDYPNFPEFDGMDLSRVDAGLILAIQKLRTASGVSMIPSPASGAWARLSGSKRSRHYARGRLSDAGDLFPARGRILDVWLQAVQMPCFGGIGIYTDTNGPDGKPWPMIHLDLRENRVLWGRDTVEGEQTYEYFPDGRFWRIVKKCIGE